ncbi:MAG: DUF2341 domain-containing protein [Candidatus Methanospirareceae archaeon]
MVWLSGWSYRKKVTITGQSGAGTNYQVDFSIGAAAGGDFHLEGHCSSFPNDIRVTDNDGTTTLDYWVEDLTVDPITMWVEVADNLDNNVDIYVYYGKSGESSASDGEAVFEQFDDFESGFSGWSGHTTDFAQSSEQAYDGSYSLKKTGADGHDNAWIQKELSTQNVQIITRLWTSDTLKNRGGVHLALSADADHSYRGDIDPGGDIIIGEADNDAHVAILASSALSAISSDQWVKLTLTRLGTSWTAKAYLADGTEIGSVSHTLDVTTGYAGYYLYDSGHYGDQFIVRKYADPEPTFSSAGAEETYRIPRHGFTNFQCPGIV